MLHKTYGDEHSPNDVLFPPILNRPQAEEGDEPIPLHRFGCYVVERQALIKYLDISGEMERTYTEEDIRDDAIIARAADLFRKRIVPPFTDFIAFYDLDGYVKFMAYTNFAPCFGWRWSKDKRMVVQFLEGEKELEAKQSLLDIGLNESDFSEFRTVIDDFDPRLEEVRTRRLLDEEMYRHWDEYSYELEKGEVIESNNGLKKDT